MAISSPNHDIGPGPIEACQVCGHRDLRLVLDLGHQPLCDSLLTEATLRQPETRYPLRQMWCPNCTLSQLDYCVAGEVVYHTEYPYRTGITKELVDYQRQMAKDLVSSLQLKPDDLVVDLGCNDGTLLKGFRELGMRVVGVEPTGIAKYAREAGIDTIQAPFDANVAHEIRSNHGPAKLTTATNVFAHMAGLGSFIRGIESVLDSDGAFVLENHYLGSVMERLQFDTIYHEHLRTYSLKSLVTLFGFYPFTVVDAIEVSRYGGNIRVTVAKGSSRRPNSSVEALMKSESVLLSDPNYYKHFRERSHQLKNDFLRLALDCYAKQKPLIGNSCPGRSSALLNFAGIGPDLMPYIAEQPTSHKLGMYLPGTHIPIVNNQRLIDEQPENVVLLAWHFAKPIAEQLRARGLRSRMFVPMPQVEELRV